MTESSSLEFSFLHCIRYLFSCSFTDLLFEFHKLEDKGSTWIDHSKMDSITTHGESNSQQNCNTCWKYEDQVNENDLKIVLQNFDMEESENMHECSKCKRCSLLEGASRLLEEKEASVDELEEAFSIFDANGDGYVDARELQKVLRRLGFEEGMKLEDCEKMISIFDGNGDGRIDFSVFRRILEIAE